MNKTRKDDILADSTLRQILADPDRVLSDLRCRRWVIWAIENALYRLTGKDELLTIDPDHDDALFRESLAEVQRDSKSIDEEWHREPEPFEDQPAPLAEDLEDDSDD